MTRLKHRLGTPLALCILTATAMLAFAGSARGQASLSFSGGNNTPLALNLNAPVQCTINAALTSNAPFFVFKNVGNPLGSQQSASGSIAYTINGGSNQSIANENSGAAVGSIGANDLFIFGQFNALPIGTTVTLKNGMLTTNNYQTHQSTDR